MHQGNDCIDFFNNQQCRSAGDNDGHFLAVLGHFKPSATVHPTHIGRAYGYPPGTVFYTYLVKKYTYWIFLGKLHNLHYFLHKRPCIS